MATDLKGFEASFFSSWEGWDVMDTFCLCFYKPVVKEGVGLDKYIGLVDHAVLDGDCSVLSLYGEDESELASLKIKLVLE